MASHKPKDAFELEIFGGLDAELLAFEGWGAEDHSVLDTLGVGDIASSAQGPSIPEEQRLEGSYAATTVPPEQHNYTRAQQDTASIATSDTSHMVSS
jgi:hypothetical protein